MHRDHPLPFHRSVATDGTRVVAVVPARGGSKGVPRKNLRELEGEPLVARAVRTVRAAEGVDAVVVSTDDAEIARVSRGVGAEVVDRPDHLSGDAASSESALLHALDVLRSQDAEPDAAWCDDNYFHGPDEDTWLATVEALVRQRRATGLPQFTEMPGAWRDGARALLYRHFAFTEGSQRRGVLAIAERRVALGALWINQHRSRLLRSVWPSVRGEAAMDFARENAEQAAGP